MSSLPTTQRAALSLFMLLLNTSISSAYLVQIQNRQVDDPPLVPPPMDDGLLTDGGDTPSTTTTAIPRPTRLIDDSFLSDESGMLGGSEVHWNTKHSLIIALVISLACLSFLVMILYIYASRRKERLRREQATRRGRAMMAASTESRDRPNVWNWGRRLVGKDNGHDHTAGGAEAGSEKAGVSKWARGAYWKGDAGLTKPGNMKSSNINRQLGISTR